MPSLPSSSIVGKSPSDLERTMRLVIDAAKDRRAKEEAEAMTPGEALSPRSSEDFKLRRKLHYDEGFQLKKFLAASAVDPEEDEDKDGAAH